MFSDCRFYDTLYVVVLCISWCVILWFTGVNLLYVEFGSSIDDFCILQDSFDHLYMKNELDIANKANFH